MFIKPFIVILLGSFLSSLFALPSKEIYCERVTSGLRWHRENSFCNHLTEKRIKEIHPILEEAYDLECKNSKDYYQIIVGQNSCFLAYQILLKELYKITRNQDFVNFEFLRPLDATFLESNLEKFFKKHPALLHSEEIWDLLKSPFDKKKEEGWDRIKTDLDNNPNISNQLISGSFTLETFAPMDSALDVFSRGSGMAGENWVPKEISLLIAIAAEHEGVHDPNLISKLKKLITLSPVSQEGILIQIFIPKDYAPNVMYIAWGGGLVNKEATKDIKKYYNTLEQLRSLENFNTSYPYQVRLLAGALSPDKIKIKRHTLVNPQELFDYETLVSNFWKNLIKKNKNL
jgi:hypothetical protein